MVQGGFQKPADHHPRELPLLGGGQQGAEVEPVGASRPVVVVVPDAVPLAVVGAVHVPGRLEVRLAVGEPQPFVRAQAHELRHVPVVRAVHHQEVHVLDRLESAGRLVLAVHRRDGDHRPDVEVEVELDVRVVGIARQAIELDGMAHRAATARVSHDGDLVPVHLVIEGVGGAVRERPPRLEVLQHDPGAAVVFPAQTAVDVVLVDRHENEATRRQQFAQIPVAGIRIIGGIVVAVGDHDERERSRAVGIPHAPVQGRMLDVEAPRLLAALGFGGRHLDERRRVHGAGAEGHRIAIRGAPLIGAAAVREVLDGVAPRIAGVGRRDQLLREHGFRIVGGQLQRLRAGAESERDRGRAEGRPPFASVHHRMRTPMRWAPARWSRDSNA